MLAKRFAAGLALALMGLVALFLAQHSSSRHSSGDQGQYAQAPRTNDAQADPAKDGSVKDAHKDAQPRPENQPEAHSKQTSGWGDWLYKLLHDHDKFWVALGTMVIGAFTVVLSIATVLLAISTKKLWKAGERQIAVTKQSADAAEKSANALVSAERAHLFVQFFAGSVQTQIISASFAEPDRDDGHLEPRLSVSYIVKNLGKTPAILREINHELVRLVDRPAEPIYSKPQEIADENRVIEGKSQTETIYCRAEKWLTVRQAKEIAAGNCSMWFIARVVYLDVVTGLEHTESVLYRYAGSGFKPDYREAYNKRT